MSLDGLKKISTAAVVLLAIVVNGPAPAGDNGDKNGSGDKKSTGPSPCGQTSRAALQACRAGARGDYWLAIGNCENLADPAEKKACKREALSALKDALSECKDQFDARQEVCQALGGEAYDPVIDPANFVAVIDNPLNPLIPGTTFIYEGPGDTGFEHDEVTVTDKTREILGVTCVEVHDVVTVDGELEEDTLDWFAQDKDGNVWYFGENTRSFADGLVVSIEGSFIAGEDGAKPGIIMEAHPQVGDVYRQEFLLGEAEDLGEVLDLNATVTVPAFPDPLAGCLETRDFSPLEPGADEHKFYAPGKGNVLTIDIPTGNRLELKEIKNP
jgi:hypothetical protein